MRTKGNNECNYDAVPNRRGPDKTPGARQRIPKDVDEADKVGPVRRRRRRRRDIVSRSTTTPEDYPPSGLHELDTNESNISAISSAMPLPSPASDILSTPLDFNPIYNANRPPAVFSGTSQNSLLDDLIGVDLFDKAPTACDQSFPLSAILPPSPFDHGGDVSHAYITSLDENNSEDDHSGVSSQPSATFTRQIWWESLLSFYISPDQNRRQNLTMAERVSAAKGITSDIRFLFNTSNYWFSFFHLPTFNSNYFDPVRRERMQPSLILALLAMSTFWQSSEDGLGRLGRERSLRFRDEAQSALDASFNAGWIDETLAQSAWVWLS
ncbi:hypothetical protein C0993_000217 [Termitomyces sp. T159_Od127]|nr:hypothetical protein C0993_000217 [Termitomyces sp. T159_Od127]